MEAFHYKYSTDIAVTANNKTKIARENPFLRFKHTGDPVFSHFSKTSLPNTVDSA